MYTIGFEWMYSFGGYGPCGNGVQSSVTCTVSPVGPGGTEANLFHGHYAFFFTGTAQQGYTAANRIVSAGSFTADGNGHIKAGIEDINSPAGSEQGVAFTGTYTLNGSQGTLTWKSALGVEQFDFFLGQTAGQTALSDVKQASLIYSDPGILGNGTLTKQRLGSASAPVSLTGSYALNLTGYPPSSVGLSDASLPAFLSGTLTPNPYNSSQQLTATVDLNSAETGPIIGTNESGTFGTPDPKTGRFTYTLTPAGSNIQQPTHFVGYLLNKSDFVILSTDSYQSNFLMSGTAAQ